MKIALVNKFFFHKGGQETLMFQEASLLEKSGHKVAVFSMNHPDNYPEYKYDKHFVNYIEFSNNGKEYNFIEKIKYACKFIYNWEAKMKFERFLQDTKPDIIHCHGIAHQITYSILPVAKKYNIPIVQTLHDYQLICPSYTLLKSNNQICQTINCADNFYLDCILNRCVKNSISSSILSCIEMNFNHKIKNYSQLIDKFISPSIFLMDLFASKGFDKLKFTHIPNFINDIEDISPEFGNQNYFLYFGRLSYEKGLYTLINTFKDLPEAKLKVVGTGPLLEELKNYKVDNNIDNVEFIGYKTANDLDQIIKGSISVILPSEWNENAPMSIIEAFLRGKPVIASNLGGIPEMVQHGETGLLFESMDRNELKTCVEKFMNNSYLVEEIGKKARKFAIRNHNAKMHLEKLLAVYKDIIN